MLAGEEMSSASHRFAVKIIRMIRARHPKRGAQRNRDAELEWE